MHLQIFLWVLLRDFQVCHVVVIVFPRNPETQNEIQNPVDSTEVCMVWPLTNFLTPDCYPLPRSFYTSLWAISQTFQAQAHLCLWAFTCPSPLPGVASPDNYVVYYLVSFLSLLSCPLLLVFLISPIFKNPISPIFICLVTL